MSNGIPSANENLLNLALIDLDANKFDGHFAQGCSGLGTKLEQHFEVHIGHQGIRGGEGEGLLLGGDVHALGQSGVPAAHGVQEEAAGNVLAGLHGDLDGVVAVSFQHQRVVAEAANQLVVPVGLAALVDTVEQLAVLHPDGANAQIIVLIGAVEGEPGEVGVGGVGGIVTEGHESVDVLVGFLVAFHLAEGNVVNGDHIVGNACIGVADLHADHGVSNSLLSGEDMGNGDGLASRNIQAEELGTILMCRAAAFHQQLALLTVGSSNVEADEVLLALFNAVFGQRHIDLGAPNATAGLVSVDGNLSSAIVGSSGGRGAVTGVNGQSVVDAVGKIVAVNGHFHFGSDAETIMYFALGMILGFIVLKFDSIKAAVVMHMSFNWTGMMAGGFFGEIAASPEASKAVIIIAAAVFILGGYMLFSDCIGSFSNKNN